ncbi:MAG: hypothetical protein AAGA91_00310 [Pseudomonadota bacterium]
MDDSADNRDSENPGTPSPATPQEALANPTRRRFSARAVAGGAVLLSLGNRAAWGQTEVIGCMSVMTLNSFNPATGMFISAPAGRPFHNEPLAQAIHDIAGPPNYIGQDDTGTYQNCVDPGDIDGVCMVIGDCPTEPILPP